MARLEEIRNGASVRGIASPQAAQILSVDWIGDQAINVVYRDLNGAVAEAVLYRDDEYRLEVEVNGRPWSFDGDGALLRLVTEANRIKLAHFFDPYLAIHTSLVDPLPHQISAVYGEMLPRQPLRFLLADDPGAGKTIMAGLLIKELIARSDLERCLVVAPGSLVEQWQDELGQKFNLEFDILTRDMIETSRSGNPFEDRNRLIVRLDVLARNEELQEKLASAREWDLIICDEAHRMSATYFGGEPLLQNVGYALELGLKALLVERGWDDDSCRIEVRHDIAKALGEAAKVGFVPAHPDLAALIATISPYYKRHGLSELVATGGLAMSPDQALAVTRSLLDQVRVSVSR